MRKVAVLMDDIDHIKTHKDTTFALMLAAQKRNMDVLIFEQKDWSIKDGDVRAMVRQIELFDRDEDYYRVLNEEEISLFTVDVVLQRKDPPFNLAFIYDSYMLDLLEQNGVIVINPPNALRAVNEKFIISQIPQATPPTLITKSKEEILDFLQIHKEAVLKPLDRMGGGGIFKLSLGDKNLSAILEAMGAGLGETLMVQSYLPDVIRGDKRILIINGEPVNHGLARIPKEGEFRANLAAGGHGIVRPLTERDYWLVEQVKPIIEKENLFLVGLDVIGDYITEINITSPTCMREIEKETKQDISGRFWEILIMRNEQLAISN